MKLPDWFRRAPKNESAGQPAERPKPAPRLRSTYWGSNDLLQPMTLTEFFREFKTVLTLERTGPTPQQSLEQLAEEAKQETDARRAQLAAEAARSNPRVRKQIIVAFASAAVLVLVVMGLLQLRSSGDRIAPAEIRGVYTTTAPKYAGTRLRIDSTSVAFENDRKSHKTEGTVRSVQGRPRIDRDTVFVIEYASDGGSAELPVRYRHTDGSLRLLHQPDVVWRKTRG